MSKYVRNLKCGKLDMFGNLNAYVYVLEDEDLMRMCICVRDELGMLETRKNV